MRILPPKTNFFTVNYVPSGSVAPGLAVTAEVEFRMSEADAATPKFHDKIVVVTGNDRCEVPLLATVPAPFLRCNPTDAAVFTAIC